MKEGYQDENEVKAIDNYVEGDREQTELEVLEESAGEETHYLN